MKKAGKHPHARLTDRAVRAVKGTGHTQRIADGGGLYLLVAPGGSKSWLLRTVVGGKRSDIGLGGASVVGLAEARDRARRLRKVAREGGNPLHERDAGRRTVPTFASAARDRHRSLSQGFKNAKHSAQWLSSLDSVFEVIGTRPVNLITRADVLRAVEPHWLARPETARRVLQRIRAIFDWCKAQGYCAGDNPAESVKNLLPRQRVAAEHHPALPYADLPTLVSKLRAAEAAESVKLALEFTILCAARTGEVLNATWAEVDLKTKTWTVPAERMKGGKEHRVPLSRRCVAILEEARKLSGSGEFIFPGRTSGKPLSNMAFLMTLRRMGYGHITTHGFRSTFRDWAEEQTNTRRAVSEAALAHAVRDKVEAAYRRTDLFDRRRLLMETWAKFVTGQRTRTSLKKKPASD